MRKGGGGSGGGGARGRRGSGGSPAPVPPPVPSGPCGLRPSPCAASGGSSWATSAGLRRLRRLPAPPPRRGSGRPPAAGSDAERRAPVKVSSIRWRARVERIDRWSASPPAGAAIRKIRSAGPSGAPKSMPVALRPKASVGLGDVLTAAVRDADAAVQAGRHLGLARGHVGEEPLQVGDATGRDHPLGQRSGGGVLRFCGQVEVDQFRGDQLTHRGLPCGHVPPKRRWGRDMRWVAGALRVSGG